MHAALSRPFLPRGALVLLMMMWPAALILPGQSLPPAQAIQGDMNRSGDTQPGGANGARGPANESMLTTLSGRLPVQLGGVAQGYYDDNIYVQPDGPGKVSDYVWSLSPFIAWNSAPQTGAVNSIQLVYAPTFIHYQENSQNDIVNQQAQGVYGYDGDKVQVVATEQFGRYQENNADYDELGIETSSVTRVQANYQMTPKTNLEVTARQSYTSDEPGLHYTEWALAGYFDYQFTPKTTMGLGGVLGAADLEGPNQKYEQINGRVGYNPDFKLSFSGTVGAELRETQGHSGGTLNPDFSLGAAYEPWDGTNLGLNAYRSYEYSGRIYGNDYLATGVSGSVAQRFLRKFLFVVSGTFENSQYRDNFSDSFGNQSYDYLSIRPEVSWTPFSGWQVRAFYQYRKSIASGIPGFVDDQVGMSLDVTY